MVAVLDGAPVSSSIRGLNQPHKLSVEPVCERGRGAPNYYVSSLDRRLAVGHQQDEVTLTVVWAS